ncbi:serine/threonine-protein kinase 17A-like [Anneissia japonica]|uniref:serine/threonine-protein kinase 17A-like n=1 Tax=Anneissia japonica TaxID=1529436 RepID=UPI001425B599|nr:serine/threonine-protein kinase 17A-like [Anneissia japonica]
MHSKIMSEEISSRYRQGDFNDHFSVLHELGRGRFAVVRKFQHKKTQKFYAAKFIRKRKKGKDCSVDIIKEIQILELTNDHPRLIDLYEVYETQHEVILVLEFAGGGEIHPYCVADKGEAFTENDVRRLVRQILEGVQFLHDQNIVHLDLKPQNILLTEHISARTSSNIKLIDYGIARFINGETELRDIVGTLDYVAPEVINYDPITLASDIWSVGVLTYVMLTGISPFLGDSKQETLLNISQINLEFPEDIFEDISEEAKDFIKRLCVKVPNERYTSKECLNHPWLQVSIGSSNEQVSEVNSNELECKDKTHNHHCRLESTNTDMDKQMYESSVQTLIPTVIRQCSTCGEEKELNEETKMEESFSEHIETEDTKMEVTQTIDSRLERLEEPFDKHQMPHSPQGIRRTLSINKENIPQDLTEPKRFKMEQRKQEQVVC